MAAALPAAAIGQITKFDHIVIIVQENRTPDNLFHGLQKFLPKADIANTGLDSKGERVVLKPLPLATPFDLGHLHDAFTTEYDNGKMDGWDEVICVSHCPAEHPAMHYVQYPDVKPYFDMARGYGFANRMFQTNQGPSFPAHLFIFSGTSQISPTSMKFAADNPQGVPNGGAGCTADPKQLVSVIGPNGFDKKPIFPCFEHQTLSDLLESPPNDPTHPISWRYYTMSKEWTAPEAIRHICQPKGNPATCTGKDYRNGTVVLWPPQVIQDIHFHHLQSVSWVIPTAQESDHSNATLGTGPSWVASIVNAIGTSEYWKNTVIFLTWDDWGGFYDHVKPPIDTTFGYYEMGFRVPLIVISPYTPKGYVSDVQHDFGSILHFVEKRYNLGLIPPGNFADARADDLMDFFDFSQKPRDFVQIQTKVPESTFMDPKRQMIEPDDD
ncbi:MAG TPA: alkaline phosphatase family protein [Rhodopila sp.]|nr:alkaline phosphatase family protein [Rhodopila sp.]